MKNRNAFTLIELIVVIAIMAVLTAMTLALVNVTQDEDRVRAASSHIQSFIEGARDRAVYLDKYYGVRILYEKETSPSGEEILYGTSLVYVSRDNFTDKDAAILDEDREFLTSGRITIVDEREITFDHTETKEQWDNLVDRKLLASGSVITIHKQFFTLGISNSPNYEYRLTKNFSGSGSRSWGYSLLLNPAVTPNQQPMTFPRDVVIDLSNSQIPYDWETTGRFDIMFDPRGFAYQQRTNTGFVNLLVAEGVDVFQGRQIGHISKEGNERIVSVHSITGSAMVSHVDVTDRNNNGIADDPFNYALLGEAAR